MILTLTPTTRTHCTALHPRTTVRTIVKFSRKEKSHSHTGCAPPCPVSSHSTRRKPSHVRPPSHPPRQSPGALPALPPHQPASLSPVHRPLLLSSSQRLASRPLLPPACLSELPTRSPVHRPLFFSRPPQPFVPSPPPQRRRGSRQRRPRPMTLQPPPAAGARQSYG
jgi:hypothetical protein